MQFLLYLLNVHRQSFLLCSQYHFSLEPYTGDTKDTMSRFMLDLVLQVAPLKGLHKESLVDVKEQLQVLLPILKGVILPPTVVLLNGSFSSWLVSTLGIQVYWSLMK